MSLQCRSVFSRVCCFICVILHSGHRVHEAQHYSVTVLLLCFYFFWIIYVSHSRRHWCVTRFDNLCCCIHWAKIIYLSSSWFSCWTDCYISMHYSSFRAESINIRCEYTYRQCDKDLEVLEILFLTPALCFCSSLSFFT